MKAHPFFRLSRTAPALETRDSLPWKSLISPTPAPTPAPTVGKVHTPRGPLDHFQGGCGVVGRPARAPRGKDRPQVGPGQGLDRAGELAEKLRGEQQIWVFAQRLDDARIDMEEIVRLLQAHDPGRYTQQLQNDVARVLVEMKEAFEREHRQRQQQGGEQSPPGPQRRRLVPPLAELKMLRAMQEQLMRDTKDLDDAIQLQGGEPNEFQKRMLRRLAVRQGNLADALDRMNRDLTGGE